MKDHRLGYAVTCPACGTNLDGALNTTGERLPVDGDPILCARCRALLVYSGSPVNSLRYPTSDEQRVFLADPDVQHVIAALGEAHRLGVIR